MKRSRTPRNPLRRALQLGSHGYFEASDGDTRSEADPGDHLEYPWELDPHTTPRRWETRKDQDGQTYSYAQFFWYYWKFDTFTRKDLDDYWETLPLIHSADGSGTFSTAATQPTSDRRGREPEETSAPDVYRDPRLPSAVAPE